MKPVVCIFAHPDDEAFGPGGTIAKLAQRRDVYIICATSGEEGKFKGGKGKGSGTMANIRREELRRSAKILGVTQVFFLGYHDGTLSNNLYHLIAGDTEKILRKLRPDTLLTYEPRGISGHLDHIAISMVTSYLFERLPFIKKLMQYCALESPERRKRRYFIHLPPGYKRSEIDLVSDVSKVWDLKLEAMRQHQSQAHDLHRILKRIKHSPREEYFLIQKR